MGEMEIVYVYQRLRKDFGRAPKFGDVEAETISETVPNPDQVSPACSLKPLMNRHARR